MVIVVVFILIYVVVTFCSEASRINTINLENNKNTKVHFPDYEVFLPSPVAEQNVMLFAWE